MFVNYHKNVLAQTKFKSKALFSNIIYDNLCSIQYCAKKKFFFFLTKSQEYWHLNIRQ